MSTCNLHVVPTIEKTAGMYTIRLCLRNAHNSWTEQQVSLGRKCARLLRDVCQEEKERAEQGSSLFSLVWVATFAWLAPRKLAEHALVPRLTELRQAFEQELTWDWVEGDERLVCAFTQRYSFDEAIRIDVTQHRAVKSKNP